MNDNGHMPMQEIVCHIVKYVSAEGSKADFDALPAALQAEVMKQIDWYEREGAWFIVSNAGIEDYGEYAKRSAVSIKWSFPRQPRSLLAPKQALTQSCAPPSRPTG